MSRIVIYGAGGFGREVLRLASCRAARTGEAIVFASDDPAEVGSMVAGVPVRSAAGLHADDRCVLAVGDGAVRRAMAARCPGFVSLFAGSSAVYDGVQWGEGAIVADFCVVAADAATRIGRHVHLNTHVSVGHDTSIGDFVTLSPRVTLGGNLVIEDDVFVGLGALIRNGAPGRPRRIGRGATIGMGAVVVGDVPAGATVLGNPARVAGALPHPAPLHGIERGHGGDCGVTGLAPGTTRR